MLLYTVGVVWGLHTIRFWTFDLFKETLLWFFATALVSQFRLLIEKQEEDLVSLLVIDNIKVVVIIEFLVGEYTFPFYIELFLIPLAVLTTGLDEVAKSKEEFKKVAKFTSALVGILGLAILFFALYSAINDLQNLGTLDTVRLVLLPIGPESCQIKIVLHVCFGGLRKSLKKLLSLRAL